MIVRDEVIPFVVFEVVPNVRPPVKAPCGTVMLDTPEAELDSVVPSNESPVPTVSGMTLPFVSVWSIFDAVTPVSQVGPLLVKAVVDALPLNCWSVLHVFACARLREASTFPVGEEIVRVPPADAKLDTQLVA